MKLDTSKIRDGHNIGDIVWVSSYHQPDVDKKPLRSQPPIKCLVMSIDDSPPAKTIYYSKTYFAPINKAGSVTKKAISPVDNTGFRSHIGNELDVFDNESECIESWNLQINDVAEVMEKRSIGAAAAWQRSKIELLAKAI